jgi:hypothetical protein
MWSEARALPSVSNTQSSKSVSGIERLCQVIKSLCQEIERLCQVRAGACGMAVEHVSSQSGSSTTRTHALASVSRTHAVG